MKHIPLSPVYRNQAFVHSKVDGNLYISSSLRYGDESVSMPDKVRRALHLCNYPYDFPASIKEGFCEPDVEPNDRLASTLVRLCKINFLLATTYSSIKSPIHNDSREAVVAFRKNISNQKDLCLPRSLYAAKTSRLFSGSGVIMIGAALPSRSMHAWVIEDGNLVDSNDREWLHHLPVAALY